MTHNGFRLRYSRLYFFHLALSIMRLCWMLSGLRCLDQVMSMHPGRVVPFGKGVTQTRTLRLDMAVVLV